MSGLSVGVGSGILGVSGFMGGSMIGPVSSPPGICSGMEAGTSVGSVAGAGGRSKGPVRRNLQGCGEGYSHPAPGRGEEEAVKGTSIPEASGASCMDTLSFHPPGPVASDGRLGWGD